MHNCFYVFLFKLVQMHLTYVKIHKKSALDSSLSPSLHFFDIAKRRNISLMSRRFSKRPRLISTLVRVFIISCLFSIFSHLICLQNESSYIDVVFSSLSESEVVYWYRANECTSYLREEATNELRHMQRINECNTKPHN